MLIYLDMCCLKRPFDDQSQPRIRLETEAVLSLLAMESDQLRFIRSAALVLENNVNPVRERAERVARWLSEQQVWRPPDASALRARVTELIALGFKTFDALHVASAEGAGAALFGTVDDRLLSSAARHAAVLRTRVCAVLECIKELPK
jgi:predicted nucleic acid-binding protein